MILTLSFRRLRDSLIKILRILFEDKEMRGDRFDDLTCSKSGALSVDIKDIYASESYKKAREQSDRVLGIQPRIHTERINMSNTRIDSLGRILLPQRVRKKITEESEVEFYELENGKLIVSISLRSDILAEDNKNSKNS